LFLVHAQISVKSWFSWFPPCTYAIFRKIVTFLNPSLDFLGFFLYLRKFQEILDFLGFLLVLRQISGKSILVSGFLPARKQISEKSGCSWTSPCM
jgi:hypothetical protein